MSIRSFSTQPCPDCKRDTTHLAMACRECGHVNDTNYEAFSKMRGRLYGAGKQRLLSQAHHIHSEARHEAFKSMTKVQR